MASPTTSFKQQAPAITNDSTVIFSTDRCYVRPAQLVDTEAWAARANYAEVAAMMSNRFPHPYTAADAAAWLAGVAAEDPPVRFAVCNLDGELVGACGLMPQQDMMCRNLEVGYWISPPFWGKGIATSAVEGLLRYGFDKFPDIHRMEAKVYGGNLGSARVLEKVGFRKEGERKQAVWKNGKLLDDWIYGLLREEFEEIQKRKRSA